MTDTLHVLVYGSLDAGVTDSLRVGAFVEPLARLGVEVRSWQSFADDLLGRGDRTAVASAPPSGDFLRDSGLTALAWADVVVFRRWLPTHVVCSECESAFARMPELAAHIRESGHRSIGPDPVLRPIVDLLTAHPELLGSRAVIYDTDDDILNYPGWTGLGVAAARERDLILRILAIADVTTTATPVLAERLRPHTHGLVRVVRNAVDPAWYGGGPEAGLAGDPRVVYYGVPVRLGDYEVARPAVDRVAACVPGLRRVWLGAAHEPRVVACVDEARPWVRGLAAWARALAAARPDIGLAPLVDEPFGRAKSELHWVEYAMVGAPTIATAFSGPGPYDVIRDGKDGLLAYSTRDWERHLRRLARSHWLRAELAGRAGERVRAEYNLSTRAAEWVDIYRWAATHGGFGRANASGPRAGSLASAAGPSAAGRGAAVRQQ